MNRETRRRLKQNEVLKRPVNTSDVQKAIEHKRLQKALDEGIILGFSAASHMLEEVATKVRGIGENRAKLLRDAFESKLIALQKEIKE